MSLVTRSFLRRSSLRVLITASLELGCRTSIATAMFLRTSDVYASRIAKSGAFNLQGSIPLGVRELCLVTHYFATIGLGGRYR
jgi:hypothetical protein